MAELANVPVWQLRTAAKAWRRHEDGYIRQRARCGWLKWMLPEPNMSVYERIDELIDEIERLRSLGAC